MMTKVLQKVKKSIIVKNKKQSVKMIQPFRLEIKSTLCF